MSKPKRTSAGALSRLADLLGEMARRLVPERRTLAPQPVRAGRSWRRRERDR